MATAEKPAPRMAQMMGMLRAGAEKWDEEEKQAFIAQFSSLFGLDDRQIKGLIDGGEEARYLDELAEFGALPAGAVNDYRNIQKQIRSQIRNRRREIEAGRNVFDNNAFIACAEHTLKMVHQAQFQHTELRRYGSRPDKAPIIEMVGYRNEYPIQFDRYYFSTTDPIEITFIEHYIEKRTRWLKNERLPGEEPMSGSTELVRLQEGVVPMVQHRYGHDFFGFVDIAQAQDYEKRGLARSVFTLGVGAYRGT